MKVLVLYRPDSEHGRIVEDFIREFKRRFVEEKLETMNIDSRDGSAIASLYDIMQSPAILVLANDGMLQRCWVGGEVPLLDEVAAYARA